MDERSLKRLLITLAVAIGIILLAKFMLTRTYTNLNKAAAARQQAAAQQRAVASPLSEAPAIALPASSPDNSTIEIAPASAAVEGSGR
ncbi:MAG TPA: hypothetical protein VIU93_04790 [Gallionellaceae bacterium]